jgi:hypothetical protein
VHEKRLMNDDADTVQAAKLPASGSHGIGFGGFSVGALLAWLVVGIPFLWGVWNTLVKAVALFE